MVTILSDLKPEMVSPLLLLQHPQPTSSHGLGEVTCAMCSKADCAVDTASSPTDSASEAKAVWALTLVFA